MKKNRFLYIIKNNLSKIFFLLFSIVIVLFLINTFEWFFFNANWNVITSNINLFAYGNYPSEEKWRPILWIIYLFIISSITISGQKIKFLRKSILVMWIMYIPIGLFLLYGGIALIPVNSRYFGGLTLSLFLTALSFIFSLPIGIILALFRQSKLNLLRKLSSIYIDSMRSVPLIAVLFFGQLLVPLFLPIGLEIDRVWRAIFAFTLFLSAYIAEDIRSGLQSIKNTQIEAANSLGLNELQIIIFILIPQSLRVALPALTNQLIGLFQNTSLMAILGLLELLGIGRSILANPEYIGQYIEVYIWLAFVYWLFCTMVALIARYLERILRINNLIS